VVTHPAQTPGSSSTRDDTTLAVPSTPERHDIPEPAPGPAAREAPPAGVAAGASQGGAQRADPDKWTWPSEGRVVSGFKANDPSRNGIDIGGREGQPVLAAASGEVVYSGSGLIGYGELIIIKHSDRLLSAYAHNKRRLVAEGDKVSAGQQVGEMGRNDRNQALLHFEIRVNGTPQDPMKFLPGR
jgi:lipoprotein NlpD